MNVIRGAVGSQTEVLRINNANSYLTILVKKENMNKRIGSVQFESEALRICLLHIARPLATVSVELGHLIKGE